MSFFYLLHPYNLQPVIEAIGTATVNALQGPVQAGYREAFQNTILPSFEKATQSMFLQINDSFQQGTQQCKCAQTVNVACGIHIL